MFGPMFDSIHFANEFVTMSYAKTTGHAYRIGNLLDSNGSDTGPTVKQWVSFLSLRAKVARKTETINVKVTLTASMVMVF